MKEFELLKRELQQRIQISLIFAHIDELLSQHGPEIFQKYFCEQIVKESHLIDRRLIQKLAPFFFSKFDRIYGDAKYALEDEFFGFLSAGSGVDEFGDGKCERFYCFDGRCIRITASESLISEGTTGYSLWEASVALLALLAQPSSTLKDVFVGKRVLELGSGTGLGGLGVAFIAQPRKVTLTDISKVYDSYTHPNLLRNRAAVGIEIDSQVVYWDELAAEPERFAPHYDVVLGCDLVYDPELCDLLIKAIRALLSPPSSQITQIVFLCALRNPLTLSAFVEQLNDETGLQVECSSIDYKSDNPIILTNPESFRLIKINKI